MGRGGPHRRRARRLGNEPPGRSWTSSARRGLLCVRVPRSPDPPPAPRGTESTFVVLGRGHTSATSSSAGAPPAPAGSCRTRVARTSRATPRAGPRGDCGGRKTRDAHLRRAPKRETFFSKELCTAYVCLRVSRLRSRDASLICRTGDRLTARCLSQSPSPVLVQVGIVPAPVGARGVGRAAAAEGGTLGTLPAPEEPPQAQARARPLLPQARRRLRRGARRSRRRRAARRALWATPRRARASSPA